MELEQIKNRITALEAKVTTKQADINRMNEEKAQYEQKIQNLSEDIQRLEQDNANKRDEIKKYKTFHSVTPFHFVFFYYTMFSTFLIVVRIHSISRERVELS